MCYQNTEVMKSCSHIRVPSIATSTLPLMYLGIHMTKSIAPIDSLICEWLVKFTFTNIDFITRLFERFSRHWISTKWFHVRIHLHSDSKSIIIKLFGGGTTWLVCVDIFGLDTRSSLMTERKSPSMSGNNWADNMLSNWAIRAGRRKASIKESLLIIDSVIAHDLMQKPYDHAFHHIERDIARYLLHYIHPRAA